MTWTQATRQPSGRACPIVLLHDSVGCVELWRSFPAVLSASTGRTVIAYDRPGFGRSDAHPGRLGLDFVQDEAATYFRAVLEQLDVDRFVACGHSVGGGMAVHCAAAPRGKCEALVTESAQAFVEDRTTAGLREAQRTFVHAHHFARLAKHHGAKAPWVLDAWIGTWLDPASGAGCGAGRRASPEGGPRRRPPRPSP